MIRYADQLICLIMISKSNYFPQGNVFWHPWSFDNLLISKVQTQFLLNELWKNRIHLSQKHEKILDVLVKWSVCVNDYVLEVYIISFSLEVSSIMIRRISYFSFPNPYLYNVHMCSVFTSYCFWVSLQYVKTSDNAVEKLSTVYRLKCAYLSQSSLPCMFSLYICTNMK